MIKKLVLFLWLVFFISNHIVFATEDCTPGDTSCTITCDGVSDDVDFIQALTDVAENATITVGSGTCLLANRITITKGVNIIGAGIGSTIIDNDGDGAFAPILTGASLDVNKHLISIVPSTPADNPIIRISGMTIALGTKAYGILYWNTSTTNDLTRVRLDNLDISGNYYIFQRYGMAHGVMDNCALKGSLDGGGSGATWTVNAYNYGNVSNFYIEDCTWAANDGATITGFRQSGNGAFRYAWRYNTITLPTSFQVAPIWDLHGNQNTQAGGFGGEIYGNSISINGNNWQSWLINQRGGKMLAFNNNVTWATSGGITSYLKEEHDDASNPANYPSVSGVIDNEGDYQPQHISKTYYWSNYKNSVLFNPVIYPGATLICETCLRTVPTANQDFWNHNESFNGTSGVGCGPLENRPATCAVGVAYWATDQSCSDLTGMVGISPATPISGTLYKCTATNVWTAYYTPYTYPHPLRNESEADETAPTMLYFQIESGSETATVGFSEAVTHGAGGNGGWALSLSGGDSTATYASGAGTSVLTYTLSRPVFSNETGTAAYTQPGNGVEDSSGNDLATASDNVINNSSLNPPTGLNNSKGSILYNAAGVSAVYNVNGMTLQ